MPGHGQIGSHHEMETLILGAKSVLTEPYPIP